MEWDRHPEQEFPRTNSLFFHKIFVPKGFLNGHACLSDECVFHYKWSDSYTKQQITVKYDDPILDIKWPIKDPILSDRDKNANIIQYMAEYI